MQPHELRPLNDWGIPVPICAIWQTGDTTFTLNIDADGAACFADDDGNVILTGQVQSPDPRSAELLTLLISAQDDPPPFQLNLRQDWHRVQIEVPIWIDEPGGAIRIAAPSPDLATASLWRIVDGPELEDRSTHPPREMVGLWVRHKREERGGLVTDRTEGSGFAIEPEEVTEIYESYTIWPDGRCLLLIAENFSTEMYVGWLESEEGKYRYGAGHTPMRRADRKIRKTGLPQFHQNCFLKPRGHTTSNILVRDGNYLSVADKEEKAVAGVVYSSSAAYDDHLT